MGSYYVKGVFIDSHFGTNVQALCLKFRMKFIFQPNIVTLLLIRLRNLNFMQTYVMCGLHVIFVLTHVNVFIIPI